MAELHKAKRLLLEHGFTSNPELANMTLTERKKHLDKKDPDGPTYKNYLKSVTLDKIEGADEHYIETPYPVSGSHYRIVYESPNSSMEEGYFWILEHLRMDRGFFDFIKVSDSYASSESSALWGNQQQRINAQQNQAQGLLANIGKFVKELFQMVRELRVLDERLEAYESWKKSDSADVTLKSVFTDMVEGGAKSPNSVFGLAQTVGFTILPDLFFNTKVYNVEDLDKTIEDMTYNNTVKNVLRRKLYQFIIWKEKTHKELINRKKFNISYLKQHWGIIKTYMQWAKPYLRNVQRLQMVDKTNDPELISSFDTNLSEVEVVAKRSPVNPNDPHPVYPVIVLTFTFRSRPEMAMRREYQQGPAHMGRLQVDFRTYAWTDKEVEQYRVMRENEIIELIGLLDSSLNETMESLRKDFEKYLKEEVEDAKKYDPEPGDKKTGEKIKQAAGDTFEPFTALAGGFADMFKLFNPITFTKKPTSSGPSKGARNGALETAKAQMFLLWNIYKKAHRMISW